jgi:hypothetical protein
VPRQRCARISAELLRPAPAARRPGGETLRDQTVLHALLRPRPRDVGAGVGRGVLGVAAVVRGGLVELLRGPGVPAVEAALLTGAQAGRLGGRGLEPGDPTILVRPDLGGERLLDGARVAAARDDQSTVAPVLVASAGEDPERHVDGVPDRRRQRESVEDVVEHVLRQMAADEDQAGPAFDLGLPGTRDVVGPGGEPAHQPGEPDVPLSRELRDGVMVVVEERLELSGAEVQLAFQDALVERAPVGHHPRLVDEQPVPGSGGHRRVVRRRG